MLIWHRMSSLAPLRRFTREKRRWRRKLRKCLLGGVSAMFVGVAGVALWNSPNTAYDLASFTRDGKGRSLSGATEVCDEEAIMVLPYLALILYMFFGLAIICDEFFEPALSTISERLKLTPDVAGPTLSRNSFIFDSSILPLFRPCC